MSSLQVTSERLTILPHSNADALELAQVGLFKAVVGKSVYITGDYALYVPEQAILPDALIDEIGLTGRLAGSKHNRVKIVRLRGEISQGIVCRPAALQDTDMKAAHENGTDFADLLGITKWVPEIPVSMSGQVQSAPDLLPWVDIENLKRYPDVFTPGEPVTATEKVHGTALLLSVVTATQEVLVASKGIAEQHLSLVETDGNLYWRAVRGHGVPEAAFAIAEKYGAIRVGVFGEVYGQGVQDLTYGATARQGMPGFAVFDIAVDVPGTGPRWLDQDEMVEVLAALPIPLPTVPRLYDGPYNQDALLVLATGREQISGTEANLREGIVVRPKTERRSDILGGRAIAKIVSDDYLFRKGGTEYQ